MLFGVFGFRNDVRTMPAPTSQTAASKSAAARNVPTRRSLPAAASSDGRLGPREIRVSDAPTHRIAVRIAVSSIRFEVAMLAIVLLYSVLVFAQLAMDDPEIEKLLGEGGTDIAVMHDAFLKVDLCFLVFFTLEIVVKLYGFGAAYLRDLFNLVDAAIVLGSFVITVVAIDIGETDLTLTLTLALALALTLALALALALTLSRCERGWRRDPAALAAHTARCQGGTRTL